MAPRVIGERSAELGWVARRRSEEHTSELQSQFHLVCRRLLEKKKAARLPTLYGIRGMVEAGALMSYCANDSDLFRRACYYADKFFRVTKLFFQSYGHPPDLHSFPTRRSSD